MSEKCNHRFQKWQAWANGIYRLYCANCGEHMGSESYLPGSFEILDTNPPALGVKVSDGLETKDEMR